MINRIKIDVLSNPNSTLTVSLIYRCAWGQGLWFVSLTQKKCLGNQMWFFNLVSDPGHHNRPPYLSLPFPDGKTETHARAGVMLWDYRNVLVPNSLSPRVMVLATDACFLAVSYLLVLSKDNLPLSRTSCIICESNAKMNSWLLSPKQFQDGNSGALNQPQGHVPIVYK
jgi:hypothetical protein